MSAKAIIGGVLDGAGRGMVAQDEQRRREAEQSRERAMRVAERLADRDWRTQQSEADRAWRESQSEADRAWQSSEAEAAREGRRGLIADAFTDPSGDVWGVTAGGERVELDGKEALDPDKRGAGYPGGGGGAPVEMTAQEKRVYDELKDRYTNPNTKETDWQGLVGHLRGMPAERGGQRWGVLADWLTGDVGAQMTGPEAREAAEGEARGRRGLLGLTSGFDSDEEQAAFIARRAQELRYGGEEDAEAGDSGATPPGDAGAPPGAGTEMSPFKATTQDDIDWFKASAPAGAIIMVDGKLYKK